MSIKFKNIVEAPLTPYERSIAAKYKVMNKLQTDFLSIKNLFELSYVNKTSEYIEIFLKIPSEPFREKLKYDVIVRFYLNSNEDNKIEASTPVEVFSNSPSFMFTYTFVYKKHNVLIEEYEKFQAKRALTEKPLKTNPHEILGFEKSLFYAFLWLRDEGFMSNVGAFLNKYKMRKKHPNKIPMSSTDKLTEYNKVKSKFSTLYSSYVKRNKVGFF